MNRRGLLASVVPSAVLLGANAASQPPAGPGGRLIRPKMGPILEAWVAEKPDVRSVGVEIEWSKGCLEVTVRVDVSGETPDFKQYGIGGDIWNAVAVSESDESEPGSFTVSDATARELIKEVERTRVRTVGYNAKNAADRAKDKALEAAPLVTMEQWAASFGDDRDITRGKVTGRRAYTAFYVEHDVVHCVALWAPEEKDGKWHVFPTAWSVGDFVLDASNDPQCRTVYFDVFNATALASRLMEHGMEAVSVSWAPASRLLGANFIRSAASEGKLLHCGSAIHSPCLGKALSSFCVGGDGRIAGDVGAFARCLVMAATVAASSSEQKDDATATKKLLAEQIVDAYGVPREVIET